MGTALISATLTTEANACPDDGTVVFSKPNLDALLAAQGWTVDTPNLWFFYQTNNFYGAGIISEVQTDTKTYTLTIKNSLSILATNTSNTVYNTPYSIQQIMYYIAVNQCGMQLSSYADTDLTTVYQCNNKGDMNILRDLVLRNYASGAGTLRAFWGGGVANAIYQIPWGWNYMSGGPAAQTISAASTTLKLVKACQKVDTKIYVINDVTVKYNGGSVNVTDATSIANYGTVAKTYLKYEFQNAGDATIYANSILSLYKTLPTYLICQVLPFTEASSPYYTCANINGTYNVTDPVTLGGTVNGLVCFRIISYMPSGLCEMHLASVPLNILEDVTSITSRLTALESNQGVGTNDSPTFAGVTVNGNIAATGVTVNGVTVPGTDDAYDLGSQTNRFRTIFLGDGGNSYCNAIRANNRSPSPSWMHRTIRPSA